MNQLRPPDADPPSRVVIERVQPEIDGGRYAIKRTPGEEVRVSADVFADGHDHIAGVLRFRLIETALETLPAGVDCDWHEVPLESLGNDRWEAGFTVRALGFYEYALEAWIDRFETWRDEVGKKFAAGQDVASELLEGAAIVQLAGERAAGAPRDAEAARDDSAWLLEVAATLRRGQAQPERVAIALGTRLQRAMAVHADRRGSVAYTTGQRVLVERERARFSTWYEMFPRSARARDGRGGTFDDVAARLPDIAAMGFDVLYVPPIHPIGRSFRKGRNNALVAGPLDPGSPWAIGGLEGGHTAVEPGLGTIEDFDRLVVTAGNLGVEIALDLAYQASPDHPFVREHPDWFRQRPDGTIKHAENPPKKYQDIYPFDFESPAWQALWRALVDVVAFWIDHGVRIFRVDNPHTKPFGFWEWLIAEVRRHHADVIFLAEAFTRPKVMRFLAKIGFSQSYSYFTWRNTREELVEHFTELTTTELREYMRPNLFANTPDILHEYLQRGGRPAFMVRLVLAGTLGASYGIYSGFEICENRAVPGTEEHLDSEKYQVREWDWNRPGHIKELVARVNQARRDSPALQHDATLRFRATDNGALLAYSKTSPDGRDAVFVVVNLDPYNLQHGWVRFPALEWGIPPGVRFRVADLLSDERYEWRDEWNYVRLEPGVSPAHVLRLVP
jgi:starch synthase (maltosyl-transferring)